jgi:hypothetical protein
MALGVAVVSKLLVRKKAEISNIPIALNEQLSVSTHETPH